MTNGHSKPEPAPKPFFSWREALLESNLPATTRHVLLTLACHMNAFGAGCFPSTRTLARQTGLSRRSVETHLAAARKASWITVQPRGYSGRGWRRHEYCISWPTDVGKEVLHVNPEVEKYVRHVRQRGGERPSHDVGKDVRLSTSWSTSIETEPAVKRQAHAPCSKAPDSGLAKPPADSRFQPIVDYYLKRTREQTETAPWDAGDGKTLNRILEQNPAAPAERIITWLGNAFDSPAQFPLQLGFRMTEFARHYAKYTNGPLKGCSRVTPPSSKPMTQEEAYRFKKEWEKNVSTRQQRN